VRWKTSSLFWILLTFAFALQSQEDSQDKSRLFKSILTGEGSLNAAIIMLCSNSEDAARFAELLASPAYESRFHDVLAKVSREDVTVRHSALRPLTKTDAGRKSLFILLEHADPKIRKSAAFNLCHSKPLDANQVFDKISKHLDKEDDENVRVMIFAQLGALGTVAEPRLIMALRDENLEVREAAASSIITIHPVKKATLDALLEVLFDSHGRLFEPTAYALMNLGPEARETAASIKASLLKMEADKRLLLRVLDSIEGDGETKVP